MLSANISYFGSACAIIINESNFAEKTTQYRKKYFMVHCRTGKLVAADADNVSFFYMRSIFFVVFRKEWMRDERTDS